jgi:hypothetical protein
MASLENSGLKRHTNDPLPCLKDVLPTAELTFCSHAVRHDVRRGDWIPYHGRVVAAVRDNRRICGSYCQESIYVDCEVGTYLPYHIRASYSCLPLLDSRLGLKLILPIPISTTMPVLLSLPCDRSCCSRLCISL